MKRIQKKMIDKRAILSLVMIITVIVTITFLSKVLCNLEAEVKRNEGIKVFQQAVALVRNNYIEDVQTKDLMLSALNGMMGSLDQHASLETPKLDREHYVDSKRIFINNLLNTIEAAGNGDEGTRVFREALTLVSENYAEELQTAIQSKNLVYSAINGMIGSLDPHSAFIIPEQYKEIKDGTEGEFGGIGIQTGMRENMLTVIESLENTPAFRAGIKAGDKIMKVNNVFTRDMSLQDAANKIKGNPSTTVKITILRDGWKEKKDFTIIREIIKIKSVKSKMLKNGIGYIKIHQFQQQTASEFSAAMAELKRENMKCLILDLRNNPGGLLHSAVKVASQFIPSGKLVVYTINRKGQKKEHRSSENNPYLALPVVVLVNENTASAAEIVAGAFKDWHRATILGTTTYGKGSVQSVVPLKDGSAVKLTIAKYYTPKGISIQSIGISPDIAVKPNIRLGQQSGHDIGEKNPEIHLTDWETEKTDVAEETVRMTIDEKKDIQLQNAFDLLKTNPTRKYNSAYSQHPFYKPSVGHM
jgi:carboxyl-terminal processing protease